ncbi:hypothetical protein [Blastococcus sp. TF02A-26]|uniref:hypothetical protein n=1 Tax=Blastococcus sp. TF02A-26 TaxID=2250577 RepID=UPI000DE9FF12|nr:hypothetical protein [Blastococcus sp. TF02A-26]RBY85999.1 hypothetical protein DQ240_11595 [Blastococcus sp. TF02A-26]
MGFDLAAVKALAADKQTSVSPCNRRCEERGTCAFGRNEPPGCWCRQKPRLRRVRAADDRSPAAP